jgi:hypothetical protein
MSAPLLRKTLLNTRALWENANGLLDLGPSRDRLAVETIRQIADWWAGEPFPPAAPWRSLQVWSGLLAPVVETVRRHDNLVTAWLELQGFLRKLAEQPFETFEEEIDGAEESLKRAAQPRPPGAPTAVEPFGGETLDAELARTFTEADEAVLQRAAAAEAAASEAERQARLAGLLEDYLATSRQVAYAQDAARGQRQLFDPGPHAPLLAGRVAEVVRALEEAGRLAALSRIDLESMAHRPGVWYGAPDNPQANLRCLRMARRVVADARAGRPIEPLLCRLLPHDELWLTRMWLSILIQGLAGTRALPLRSTDPPSAAAGGGTPAAQTQLPGGQTKGAATTANDQAVDATVGSEVNGPDGAAGDGAEIFSAERTSEEWCFAPSGNGYYISGFGESGHLSGYKGLADIARLLATPSVPVPMLDLDGADQQLRNDRRSRQPAVDVEGVQRVAEQIRELRVDLERAERQNNTVEADAARKQIEDLEASLAATKGLGGKVRDLNDPFNKLRPKIHGRLQTVYEAMRKANPPLVKLAEHFESSISSEGGTAFVYRPAGDPPHWQLQLAVEK